MSSGWKVRLRALLWLGITAPGLVAGCGDGDSSGPAPDCDAVFEPCDPTDPSCRAATSEALACMMGQRVTTPSVETWAPADALDHFTPPMQSAEQMQLLERQLAALALFRLVPAHYSSMDAVTAYSNSVGMFYDPAEDRIVVIEREQEPAVPDDAEDAGMPSAGAGGQDAGVPAADHTTELRNMVHEITHAARDQRTGLQAFYAEADTTDAWLSRRAVVEGEAQLYAQLAWLDATGVDPATMDWDQALRAQREATLSAFLATDDPYSLVDRFLPYPYGYSYVVGAWREGGRNAVDAVFEQPPRSTRELTAGFGAELPGADATALLDSPSAVPRLPERYTPVGAGQYGIWLVDACIQRFRDEPTPDLSWDLMRRLESDMLSLYHDTDSDSAVAIWRLRFSDEDAAEAMEAAASWPAEIQVRVEGADAVLLAREPDGSPLDPTTLEWQPVRITPPSTRAVDNPLLAATPAPL